MCWPLNFFLGSLEGGEDARDEERGQRKSAREIDKSAAGGGDERTMDVRVDVYMRGERAGFRED